LLSGTAHLRYFNFLPNPSKNKGERESGQNKARGRERGVIKTMKGFDTQHIVWLN
jgi:hypothetical protein